MRNNPSFSNFTVARLVTGALASGIKALRSADSCFSEANFKRTLAFALIAILAFPMLKHEVQSNKQNLTKNKN
jgi:hypothetical protein